MDRKKGNALLIAIGGMKKPPKVEDKPEEDGDTEEFDSETELAQGILDAIKNESAEELASALKDFLDYCS